MSIRSAKIRCAIYTRESSDEGLEQDFNSLRAQREACSAYILSQASEAWSLLPGKYDDGGLSGVRSIALPSSACWKASAQGASTSWSSSRSTS